MKGTIIKIEKYDVPAVRKHVIRVTGATEVKFAALILYRRWQTILSIAPDPTNF